MNENLINEFRVADLAGLPDLANYDKALDQGLWVLLIAKKCLDKRKLTAKDVVDVLVNAKDISVTERAVVNAFNRAEKRLHIHREKNGTYYEIMALGVNYLLDQCGSDSVSLHYFEAGKLYQSKRVFTSSILADLKGDLKIVDPYCGPETLDILSKIKNTAQLLTRLDNLREPAKNIFCRELRSFQREYHNLEVRNYSQSDVHDRYVLSDGHLIILGHSLKDLGAKESMAVKLHNSLATDLRAALLENFNRRWKVAQPL